MSTKGVCKDMQLILDNYDVIMHDPEYGWVLKWIEITNERNNNKRINEYGITIKYCPLCGKKLK
jgi:hypothetical protein